MRAADLERTQLHTELPKVEERTAIRQQVRAFSRAGDVMRFHTRSQVQPQNVGAHTYGVLWLLYVLTDGASLTTALTYAAMIHDVPEFVTGDFVGPTKRELGGDKLSAMERRVLEEARLPNVLLDEEGERLLKLADLLEGMRHCVRERQLGNQLIKTCYQRYKETSLALLRTARENYVWSFFTQLWEEANNAA